MGHWPSEGEGQVHRYGNPSRQRVVCLPKEMKFSGVGKQGSRPPSATLGALIHVDDYLFISYVDLLFAKDTVYMVYVSSAKATFEFGVHEKHHPNALRNTVHATIREHWFGVINNQSKL